MRINDPADFPIHIMNVEGNARKESSFGITEVMDSAVKGAQANGIPPAKMFGEPHKFSAANTAHAVCRSHNRQ